MEDRPASADLEVDERPQRRREWSGWLRSIVLPLLIVAAIVGGLWYFQGWGGSSSVVGSDGFGTVELPAARNATGESPSGQKGRAAPDFLLERIDAEGAGDTLRLSDLQGQPVLVNFFATWCPPCRDEVPEIVRAYEAHRDQGLVVVAVDLQEADEGVRAFAEEFGMAFPIVVDRTGEVAQSWHIGGPIRGIPSSYFVGENGVIEELFYGPMMDDIIEKNLTSIMP
jgi:cytochrome c biogenesis protein CcmG/thiol:disulfide interchange protein DsbE